MAEGGTIFLDEVGELPVDLQAKMLRAIQEKEIRPVGSARRVPINIRILAATNRDLEQAVTQGTFRRDLYFRLNVLSLRIPPLRERRQDIPLLVGHFLDRMTRTSGIEKVLSDDALKAMLAYDWPGNVRELENCLERSYAFTSGPAIHINDLPREIANLPTITSLHDNGNSHLKIVPIAELEKQTILNAITELNGDKTASRTPARHRYDDVVSQAERLRRKRTKDHLRTRTQPGCSVVELRLCPVSSKCSVFSSTILDAHVPCKRT